MAAHIDPCAARGGAIVSTREKLLLNAREAAALLGLSLRTFHARRKDLPPPIVLGNRCVRWRSSDLTAFVAGLDATTEPRPEPPQLAAGRARRRARAEVRT